jgi:hypothetical protein
MRQRTRTRNQMFLLHTIAMHARDSLWGEWEWQEEAFACAASLFGAGVRRLW